LDEEHEKDIKVVQEIEESPRDDDVGDSSPGVEETDVHNSFEDSDVK